MGAHGLDARVAKLERDLAELEEWVDENIERLDKLETKKTGKSKPKSDK